MNTKIKKALNVMSYIGVILPLLLALLVPEPYSNGVTSDVFGDNIAALLLFVFACLITASLCFVIYHLTKTITYDTMRTQINSWTSSIDVQNMHALVPTLLKTVEEMQVLDNKTARQKQREHINALNNAWETEKKLNGEIDEKLKAANEKIEKLQKENKELFETMKNRDNEMKDFINEVSKNNNGGF